MIPAWIKPGKRLRFQVYAQSSRTLRTLEDIILYHSRREGTHGVKEVSHVLPSIPFATIEFLDLGDYILKGSALHPVYQNRIALGRGMSLLRKLFCLKKAYISAFARNMVGSSDRMFSY